MAPAAMSKRLNPTAGISLLLRSAQPRIAQAAAWLFGAEVFRGGETAVLPALQRRGNRGGGTPLQGAADKLTRKPIETGCKGVPPSASRPASAIRPAWLNRVLSCLVTPGHTSDAATSSLA